MRISIHYSNDIRTAAANDSSEGDNSDDDYVEHEEDLEEEEVGEIQTTIENPAETATIIAIEATRLATEIVKGDADNNIRSDHFISLVLDDMISFARHPKNILRETPETLIDVIKTTLSELYHSREVVDYMSKLYSDYILR